MRLRINGQENRWSVLETEGRKCFWGGTDSPVSDVSDMSTYNEDLEIAIRFSFARLMLNLTRTLFVHW